jgi:hypothetical protein
MSQLQLTRVSKEIIEHAEERMVPQQGLPKVVDDYFVQRLKQDEMQHAEVNPGLYEGMRKMVQAEIVPLYERYRQETARFRERRQKRKLWQYVLCTAGVFEALEAVLTRGRSIAPMVLIPTFILYSLIGFIIYAAAQYFDELQMLRARKSLEKSIEGLEGKVQTDVDYDNLRRLVDSDVLRAEAVEILTHYEKPDEFWRDYRKIREADPTVPSELKQLKTPAFERFLKYHVDGHFSDVARQQRFDRLFIEAHEVLLSRDRTNYVIEHLKSLKS